MYVHLFVVLGTSVYISNFFLFNETTLWNLRFLISSKKRGVQREEILKHALILLYTVPCVNRFWIASAMSCHCVHKGDAWSCLTPIHGVHGNTKLIMASHRRPHVSWGHGKGIAGLKILQPLATCSAHTSIISVTPHTSISPQWKKKMQSAKTFYCVAFKRNYWPNI